MVCSLGLELNEDSQPEKWQEVDMGSGIRGKESLYDAFPCFDSLLKLVF